MMKSKANFPGLLEGFFSERLMQQKQASSHTIASYRDSFRYLLRFTEKRLHKPPSRLTLKEIDAPLIAAFLNDLEKNRSISPRTRNLRLTAIRSFFRYAALEAPAHSHQIQRVLAIPSKRFNRALIHFLSRAEVDALLAAPEPDTWSGRRDQALLMVAVQTGLRLSELNGLKRQDVVLGTGAHVRCTGKGRKERCTPLTKQARTVLKNWLNQPEKANTGVLFPNARGGRLSSDGVRYILSKHIATASKTCPSLVRKKVTPHVLRHTMAMELLQAGVDRTVIALWLGHESVETTQVYLHADLSLKEKILAKSRSSPNERLCRYKPDDDLMSFLKSL
jgi:site-specific recombinase XerD